MCDATIISNWKKAKASGANGQCVEITLGVCGQVHVRDSHTPSVVINVPPADARIFLEGARSGDFDDLIRKL
jgi:Domain of unknown function (DUF397)